MKKFRIIFLFSFLVTLTAQQVDPNLILEKVKEKIDKVNDYSVEAIVKVDVDFLRVPESNAKIYFKKPDKVKMESDGFALLPRQSFNFSPAILLREDYTAVYAKEDTVDGNNVDLIKILPLSDSTQIILSNLWIDKDENVVRKIETSTKNAGTVVIELSYGDFIGYALPSELKISFKVEGMDLPTDESDGQENNPRSRKFKSLSGSVIIEYSDYKINEGIEDEFFEEQEKTE